MLLGQKGVKYGLQLPAKPAQKQARKPQAAISAFQEGPDDEVNIGQQIAKQQAKISTDVKVANLHAKALAEDPSIFDYDSHFDSMQEQKVRPAIQEKIQRKSRYIEALQDKAVQREREQNVVYERRLAKERSAEDHLFGDKEKFVTAAYKKKLEEDKKWLAEEKLREAQEVKNDVVKKGHMGDFYRNILKSNDVRTGLKKPEQEAGTPASEASVATAAAARSTGATTEATAAAAQGTAAAARSTGATTEATAAAAQATAAAARMPGSHGEAAAPAVSAEEADWSAAKAARQRHIAGPNTAAMPSTSATQHTRHTDSADPGSTAGTASHQAQDSAEEQSAAAQAPPEPSKEDRIAAAREKYLSRKRQKTGA